MSTYFSSSPSSPLTPASTSVTVLNSTISAPKTGNQINFIVQSNLSTTRPLDFSPSLKERLKQLTPEDIKSSSDRLLEIVCDIADIFNAALDAVMNRIDSLLPNIGATRGAGAMIMAPVICFNIYDLCLNWKTFGLEERLTRLSDIAVKKLSGALSMATFLQETPWFSTSLQLNAAKVAAVLGPVAFIGGAIFATALASKSAVEADLAKTHQKAAEKLIDLSYKIDFVKIGSKPVHIFANPSLAEKFFKHEANRFSVKFNFSIYTSIQQAFLAAGLGSIGIFTALVGAGILVSTAATPIGWALLGILAATTLVGVGVYAYTRWKLQQANEKTQPFVQELTTELLKSESLRQQLQPLATQVENSNKHLAELKTFQNADSTTQSNIKSNITKQVADFIVKEVTPVSLDKVFSQLNTFNIKLSETDKKALETTPPPSVEELKNILENHINNPENSQWSKTCQMALKNEIEKDEKKIETIVQTTAKTSLEGLLKDPPTKSEEVKRLMIVLSNGNQTNVINATYIDEVLNSSSWPGQDSLLKQLTTEVKNSLTSTGQTP